LASGQEEEYDSQEASEIIFHKMVIYSFKTQNSFSKTFRNTAFLKCGRTAKD
jgi:hypothetical protein